ncbi:MAG: ATP-dependent DNA helicase RecG [Anaerolineae bacterium]|nr:ATP-dependent DNA helicase RecG [Anaerolineae bacterium]
MPSALETLVKILKLEQDTDYNNTAVIGGLQSFADHWARDAHQQAKKPEHHQLIDEIIRTMREYPALEALEDRHESIKYMMGRIMGRIPPPADLPPSDYPSHEPEPVVPPPTDAPADVPTAETVAEVPPPAPAPKSLPRRRKPQPLSPEKARQVLDELQAPTTTLHRVGDKMAEKLSKLGIETVSDMLFTFPRRYDDYTQMKPLSQLKPGEIVTVAAAVRSVDRKVGRGNRPYLLVVLDDETALLQVAFFNQPWLQRQFKRGSQVVLSGTVDIFRGQLLMTNPEWEMLERENLHTGRIVPVYPLTKGLSARTIRRLMRQVIDQWANRIPDTMPESVLERTELADLGWSLQQVHFPNSFDELEQARQRLSFDELFLFQMGMMGNRQEWQSVPGQPLRVPDDWLESLLVTLPYTLTSAQEQALDRIRADIARDVPMNRLLQGDVGSGKTVVAAAVLAIAVQNGKQAAFMAPTSILAEQHMRSVGNLLHQSPVGDQVQLRLLTGNTSETERQEIYAGLADGSINVVIGTHALIQANVEFRDLALAVIDEQHRFGVEQRGSLRGKGTNPHILVMTATPIPRTLALTLYADLDLSIIDEMPPGRTPVETRVLQNVERERAYSFIQAQIDKGRQAFIVYPLVEASDKLEDVGAAVGEYERLKTEIFPKRRVGLLHGQMRPAEKDAVMKTFAAGEIDILVSTSVIEVGIDVPNASVILIENADRFGLAQLHQFRGRVGRGEHKSFCLLIAESVTPEATQRLTAMEKTTDGFKLAEIDWSMRGPGDMLGVRQSGDSVFRLAQIVNPRLVELAQREARTVYAEDPALEQPEHHLLARRVDMVLKRRADVS